MEQGFYKFERGAKRDTLIFGTNLENKDWSLKLDQKDSYNLPIGGFYYFDSLSEACKFFNIEEETHREYLFPTENEDEYMELQ